MRWPLVILFAMTVAACASFVGLDEADVQPSDAKATTEDGGTASGSSASSGASGSSGTTSSASSASSSSSSSGQVDAGPDVVTTSKTCEQNDDCTSESFAPKCGHDGRCTNTCVNSDKGCDPGGTERCCFGLQCSRAYPYGPYVCKD